MWVSHAAITAPAEEGLVGYRAASTSATLSPLSPSRSVTPAAIVGVRRYWQIRPASRHGVTLPLWPLLQKWATMYHKPSDTAAEIDPEWTAWTGYAAFGTSTTS